jgi:CRISPR/Cas system-associated protein Cas10 (large subunit of type III CRISPR-Cas system)
MPNAIAATPGRTEAGNSINRSPAPAGGSFDQREKTPAAMASRPEDPSSQPEAVYGKEIAALQQIMSQRKTLLDSSTVVIIERNLRIIDAAIEQSRAALAKDPASLLLSEQLTHALDKKVELLRTAAQLPAST